MGSAAAKRAWLPLFGTLTLVVVATLFPYQFVGDVPARGEGMVLERPLDMQDVIANVLLFWPFGVAVASIVTQRQRLAFVAGFLALVASLVLSIGVEELQHLLPSRDPSLRDVVANTIGGGLGGLCLLAWPARLLAAWRRIVDTSATLCHVRRPMLALCAYFPLLLVAAGVLQTGTRLGNWDRDFPLIIGNEATGDRPWVGQLRALEVAGEALPVGQARASMGVSLSRLLPDSIILSYSHAEGGSENARGWSDFVRKGARASVGPEGSGFGIPLSSDWWLESPVAGREIAATLRRTNQLAVRLICLPATLQQTGPARIVSISTDPYHRNLTLGQEGHALVVRLRTPITGPNGREPELVVPNAFAPGLARTILVTYDGAILTVFTDGAPSSYSLDLSPGAILAQILLSPNPLDLPGYNLVFTALALIPVGFLLAVAARRRSPHPLVEGLIIVLPSLLCAAALEGSLMATSGRFLRLTNVAVATTFCLGAAMGAWSRFSRRVLSSQPGQ